MTYEDYLIKFDKLIKGVAYKFDLKMDYEDRVQEGYIILYEKLDNINKIDNENEQAAFLKTCMINHFKYINEKEHKQLLYITDSIYKENNTNGDDFNLLENIEINDCRNLDCKDDYIEKRREYQKKYQKEYRNRPYYKEYRKRQYEKTKQYKIQHDKERREKRKELFYNMSKEDQERILEIYGCLTYFVNNTNPETIAKKREYQKEYYKKNREKIREYHKKRYQEKKNNLKTQ